MLSSGGQGPRLSSCCSPVWQSASMWHLKLSQPSGHLWCCPATHCAIGSLLQVLLWDCQCFHQGSPATTSSHFLLCLIPFPRLPEKLPPAHHGCTVFTGLTCFVGSCTTPAVRCCRTSRDAELFRLASDDGSKDLRRSFSLASGAAAEDLVIFTLPPGQQDAAAALLAVCKRTTGDELQIAFQDGEQLQVGTAAGSPAVPKRSCTQLPRTCTAAAGQHASRGARHSGLTSLVSRSMDSWALVCSAMVLRANVHLPEAAVLAGLAHLARWPAVQDLLLPLVVDLRRTNMLSHAVHRYIESVTIEAKQSIRSATFIVWGLSGQFGVCAVRAPALVSCTGPCDWYLVALGSVCSCIQRGPFALPAT